MTRTTLASARRGWRWPPVGAVGLAVAVLGLLAATAVLLNPGTAGRGSTAAAVLSSAGAPAAAQTDGQPERGDRAGPPLQLAAAAPSCRPGSCTGKDPKATGCARDARKVREFSTLNTRVELRYSPRCRAAWTRWTTFKSHFFSDTVFIRRYNRNGTVTQYSTNTRLRPGSQGWTRMITRTAGSHFRSCNFVAQQCTRRWP